MSAELHEPPDAAPNAPDAAPSASDAARGPDAARGEASGGIQSLDAALRVLAQLSRMPGAAGVSDLARLCDMPVSKVHRYLASFAHAGLVRQNGRSGTYDLGAAARRLGLAAIARHDIVNAASDGLADLSAATGCTSLLAVWGDNGPTVIRWERAPSLVVTSFGLGTTLPLLSSATGRVCYAFLPDPVVGAVADKEIGAARRRPALLADLGGDPGGDRDADRGADPGDPNLPAAVRRMREAVVAARMAGVDGRYVPGLVALAAPVVNWQGELEAAVTLIGTDAAILEPEGPTAARLRAFCEDHSVSC